MKSELRQETACTPTIADRLLHVIDQWETSLTFFCLVFGFFLGLVLVINAAYPLLRPDTAYAVYGTLGMPLVGAVYVALTAYAALYPERHGGYAAIAVIAGTGLYASIHARDVVGIGFWSLAVVTVAMGVARMLRAVQRGARP